MITYKNILVPVDGEDSSNQALNHAISISEISGASITLLSVANMAYILNEFSHMENCSELAMDAITASAQSRSMDILKQAAARIPSSIPVKSIFKLGAPETSILEEQQALPADLICMGRGSNQPLQNFLLGSVSTYAVTHASCPILLARDKKKGSYHNILVPIDGSESSLQALKQAELLAKGNNASLTVLYVASVQNGLKNTKIPDMIHSHELQALSAHMKTKGDNAFLRCKEQLSLNVPVQCLYKIGSPGSIILQTADTTHADLIIMGSRGLSRIKSVLLGSVGRYVASHSGLPVLIIR